MKQYWGSVRFYKHLILTVVALLILIPTLFSIGLLYRNMELKQQCKTVESESVKQEKQLRQLQAELTDVREQTKEAVTGQVTETAEGEKPCFDTGSWELLLVNDIHPLPEWFSVALGETENGHQVDKRIIEELEQMLHDGRQQGMALMICSSFRNEERQLELFQNDIGKYQGLGRTYKEAFFKSKRRTALPGASEHQTGLAVDIVGERYQSLDDGQAETPEAKWLAENCYKYGFVLRYPQGKSNYTGIDYESWHFRFVGKEAAAYMTENHLVLEEFLAQCEGTKAEEILASAMLKQEAGNQ